MPGHAKQRPHILHHQSVALIDMFNFKPPIVFEILKFKHPAINWPRAFLRLTREPDFRRHAV